MIWVILYLNPHTVFSPVSRPPSITVQPARDIYYKPGETVSMVCDGHGDPKPRSVVIIYRLSQLSPVTVQGIHYSKYLNKHGTIN